MLRHSPPLSPGYDRCNARRTNIEPIRQCPASRTSVSTWFDGKCVLCSSFAQFIPRKDRHARFRLLAAQSELGSTLYRHLGLDPVSYETYVLLQDGKAYFRSEASIRIVDGLGGHGRFLRHLPGLSPRRFAMRCIT